MDVESFRQVIDELCCGFEPESSYWVNVTYILNPHDFHVRPCKYDRHLQRLESYIQDCSEVVEQVARRQLVVFQSTKKGRRILRGQIFHIVEKELSKTCNIFALDYGFLEKKIKSNQVFKCADEIFQVPPMAIRCYLHMSAPVGPEWTGDSVDAFKYYLGEESVKIFVKHKLNTKLVVVLINTCPDDMATMLAMTGYGTLGYVDPYASKCPSSSKNPPASKRTRYVFKERQVNDTLHVRMVSGQTLSGFFVAEVGEYREILELQDDINLYATREREIRIEEMTIGRPVLMYVDQKLRSSLRAVIEDVSPSGTEATLRFIDNGKTSLVKKPKIKAIVQDLLKDPPLAIYCKAEEIPSEIKSDDFFLPGFEFKITIKELGSDFEIPNIVTISEM